MGRWGRAPPWESSAALLLMVLEENDAVLLDRPIGVAGDEVS
jgi:hypothetical protein